MSGIRRSGLVVAVPARSRGGAFGLGLLLFPVGLAVVGLEHGARRALLVGHREDVALRVVEQGVAVLPRQGLGALRRVAHEGVRLLDILVQRLGAERLAVALEGLLGALLGRLGL